MFVVGMIVLAWLGWRFHYSADDASTAAFWPASGLFVAALIITPYRRWWAVVLLGAASLQAASWTVSLRPDLFDAAVVGWTWWAAPINALEAIVGAAIVRLAVRRPAEIGRLTTVLAVIIGAGLVAPAFAAWLGVAVIAAGSTTVDVVHAWQLWWFADALGVIVVAPWVLAMARRSEPPVHDSPRGFAIELTLLLGLLAGTGAVSLGARWSDAPSIADFPYFVLLPLVWACLRFGVRTLTSCLLLVAIGAALSFDSGRGVFYDTEATVSTSMLAMQLFLCSSAVTLLVLSSVASERRASLRSLLQENQRSAEQAARLQLLLNEVNHRVRNNLATLLGVLDVTEAGPDRARLPERIRGRIIAIARVHNVLSRRRWTPTPLREILGVALEDVEPEAAERIEIDGPRIPIRADHVQSLAMLLYELQSNATRWGGLRTAAGRVRIAWRTEDERLVLRWTETGVESPDLSSPGQGLTLVRGLAESDLSGRLASHAGADRLEHVLTFGRELIAHEDAAPTPAHAVAAPT